MNTPKGRREVSARIPVDDQVYSVVTCTERDGRGYHGFCRDVPGIHVWEEDEIDAAASCKESASVYIRAALAAGDPLPKGFRKLKPRTPATGKTPAEEGDRVLA